MEYTNKNLTVMFTDICGFTKQTGKTSRRDMMQRLAKHNALLLPVIEAWGGTLIKSIGDSFLLTFESPTDALHCALCLQHTLREYNQTAKETQKIHLKISVNSGEITLTDDDVFGDPVNVAAKIEKATQPNETLFTEAVFLSMNQSEVPCEPAGSFAAKGENSAATELYRLVADESTPSYQSILSEFRARIPQKATTRPKLILKGYGKIAGLALAASTVAGVAFSVFYSSSQTVEGTTPGNISIGDQINISVERLQPAPAPAQSQRAPELEWAKLIVNDPVQLKLHSNVVIEKISNTFQTRLDSDVELQNLLRTAMASRIYWEAREKSFSEAGKLVDAYKGKYLWIKDWGNFEREQHLGGLHNLTRDQWRSQWSERWFEHMRALYQHAENDADFGMRVALEVSSINRKHNKVAAQEEQDLVSKAIKMKPELLTSERKNLINLTQSWLKIEQEDKSFARELARKHLYKELRPWLITGLQAENTYRSPPEPDFPLRQNCLALLADQKDLDAVGNVLAYLENNIPVFMRATETVKWGDGTIKTLVFLTEEQIRRVLQLPMNEKEKAATEQLVGKLIADIQADNGPWGKNNDALQAAKTIEAALLMR
jgi:class 3 adenylate cyclase